MVSSDNDVMPDNRLESNHFSSDSSGDADPELDRHDDHQVAEAELLGVDPFSHKIEMPAWMW